MHGLSSIYRSHLAGKPRFFTGFETAGVTVADLASSSGSALIGAPCALVDGPPFLGETSAAMTPPLTPARILLIDDERAIGSLIEERLSLSGYACDCALSGRRALDMVARKQYSLAVCDIRLPDMDGIEVLKQSKEADPDLAVMMLSAVTDTAAAVSALKSGAFDYIVKPCDIEDLTRAINDGLARRSRAIAHRLYQQSLESKVRQNTREILQHTREYSNLILNTIEALISTLEAKDTYTEGHSWKVALLSANLARQLNLDAATIENISLAGLLHDIGKIGVPDAILNKPDKLTEDEYEFIKQHPVIGEKILSPLEPLRSILPCLRHHHEWWNGNGYPDGLKGEEIPLAARILSIADSYDAITSRRSYRPGRSREAAFDILKRAAGVQFDMALTQAFVKMPVSYFRDSEPA